MAEYQAMHLLLTHCNRGQAPSHILIFSARELGADQQP